MKKPEGVRFRENLKNRHIYSGMGFPGGSHSERPTCNAGDMCSVPGSRRSPLGNPIDRRARQATDHGVAKRWTLLKQQSVNDQ